MNKLSVFFILIIMQLTLSGCGDLFGKKVVEKPLNSSRLKADCELDMDQFSEILEAPITPAINCLEKNLNIFMDVSELGKGGKLSRVALTNYLKRNRREIPENTYSIINAIFSLSTLITGEKKDFISRENVAKIIDLVRQFNLHSYRYYSYTFGSTAPATLEVHESHRAHVEAAAHEIEKALEKIYVADRGGQIHYLDIMELIKGFVKEGDEETLEKIEGMLFVKKIILGGDTATITHKELGFIFSHLPKLLSLVLDVVRFEYLTLEQKDTMTFIKEDVIDMANILFHPVRGDRRFEGLFDVDMAIKGIDRFIKDDNKKLTKYRVLIKEAVRVFTKTKNDKFDILLNENEEQWVTGKDLEKIFSHAFNVTSRALAFHQFYNSPNIKPLLESPQSVNLNPKDFELEFPQNKVDLVEFTRIVNTYRYMKGSFNMTYYSLDYRRNPNGAAEISMYEYLIKTFFGYYGSSLSMGDKQLRGILKKFENELIEMDIILPRRSRNTAETIALLGSLFQSQSDDNKVLDVDEATEFAISLVTAIDAKKKLFASYGPLDCARDDYNRLDPVCFKDNFYKTICENYRPHFPRLFAYLGADPKAGCEQNFNSEHNMAYLNSAAQAARSCHIYPDDNSEIEYSEGDVMSILLAMMHIETTITRWDKNLNNTMDPNEVNDAWSIYRPAIIGMLPDQLKNLPEKLQETVAKLIYQYLVKFEESPKLEGKDLWKTLGNLAKLLAKKAPAHRKNIASILKVVSDESRKKALAEYEANPNDPSVEKPFDCNWMRNPENIPRD